MNPVRCGNMSNNHSPESLLSTFLHWNAANDLERKNIFKYKSLNNNSQRRHNRIHKSRPAAIELPGSLCYVWRKQLFVGFSQKVGRLVWSGWDVDEKSEEEGGICFSSWRKCMRMCNVCVTVNVCSFKVVQTLHYTLPLPRSFTRSCFLCLSCYRKSISLLAVGCFDSQRLLPSALCGSIYDSQMCGSTNRMCRLLPNAAFNVEVVPLRDRKSVV